MAILRRMKLKTRLLTGFAILILLGVVNSLSALYFVSQLNSGYQDINQQLIEPLLRLNNITYSYSKMDSSARGYLLAVNDTERDNALQEIRNAFSVVDQDLNWMLGNSKRKEGGQLINAIRAKGQSYTDALLGLKKHYQVGGLAAAKAHLQSVDKKQKVEALSAVGKGAGYVSKEKKIRGVKISQAFSSIVSTQFVLTLVSTVVGILLSFFL